MVLRGAASSFILMEGKDDFELAPEEKKPSVDKTVQKLLQHMGSPDVRRALESFFERHSAAFDADCAVAEQKLEYTQVFDEYQRLYESLLDGFASRHGLSQAAVLEKCRDALDARGPPDIRRSIDSMIVSNILASTTYERFIRMMQDKKRMSLDAAAREFDARGGGEGKEADTKAADDRPAAAGSKASEDPSERASYKEAGA